MTLPIDPNAPTDFDFFIGSWYVRHRRLKERPCGCTESEEFDGTSIAWKALGRYGNVDDN